MFRTLKNTFKTFKKLKKMLGYNKSNKNHYTVLKNQNYNIKVQIFCILLYKKRINIL